VTPSVSHVKIVDSMNSKLFYNILDKCPNLEYLALGNLPTDVKQSGIFGLRGKKETGIKRIDIRHDYRTPGYSPLFLHDLFIACPQISEVKMQANYVSETLDKRLLRALKDTKRLENLKTLHVNSAYTLCKVLSPVVLPQYFDFRQLRKLTLCSFSCLDEFKLFRLLTVIPTLTDLKLKVAFSGRFTFHFPQMNNLEKLTIGIPLPFVQISTSETINYSALFPKLKTLKFKEHSRNLDIDDWFSPDQNPHQTIRELHLPSSIDDPGILSQITGLFPNVIKFKHGSASYPGFPTDYIINMFLM